MAEVIQGSRNHFGPRSSESGVGTSIPDELVKTLVVPLVTAAGATTLTDTFDSTDATFPVIPAYSYIKSCAIYVEDAFTVTATATGIDVGLTNTDGTANDPNGLVAVGGVGAVANLTAGKWDAGDGALIGAGSGAKDSYVSAAWAGGTDTLTGTAVVYVEYIPKLTAILADAT